MEPIKFTTQALQDNQHLIKKSTPCMIETFAEGYTDGKRDKSLDGFYYRKELKFKN